MIRGKSKAIEEVLDAFLTVFTQPLEQEVGAAVRAAAVSIVLVGLGGTLIFAADGGALALDLSSSALVLVLFWIVVTSIVSVKHRARMLARNLSVLSFWIAATVALVLSVNLLFPRDLDRDIRFWSCVGALMVLVPFHLTRSGYGWASVWMTLLLWLSTGTLAYRAIYY